MATKAKPESADGTPQEPVVQPTIDVPADSAVTVPDSEPTPEPEQIEDIVGVTTDAHNTDAKPVNSTVGEEQPAPPVPTEREVVEGGPAKTTYTVEAADLNAYPELSQQGVQYKDEVEYGSKWVNKYDTAQKDSFHREAWPVQTEPVKQGITFKE